PTPCDTPQYRASSVSKAATSGPSTNAWFSITSRSATSISSLIVWYWAFKSRAGTEIGSVGRAISSHSIEASNARGGVLPPGEHRTPHASPSTLLCQWALGPAAKPRARDILCTGERLRLSSWCRTSLSQESQLEGAVRDGSQDGSGCYSA